MTSNTAPRGPVGLSKPPTSSQQPLHCPLFSPPSAISHLPPIYLAGLPPMASIAATSLISAPAAARSASLRQAFPLGSKSISFVSFQHFPSLRSQSASRRFQISCAAKPETVEKVCNIVKKQLALEEGQVVTGESTFSGLGADSLDTVEIVMGLEEEFGISVEEESAQNIATVQDAADLIEKLVEKNSS